jgi:hypothetical protein
MLRAVNERDGSATLRAIFEAAGCAIVEGHPLVLESGTVSLDGWDPVRRVGYEFVTTEAGDREEFTTAVVDELEARIARGEFFVFLIDEAEIAGPEILERAATRFLDHLRARGVIA